MEEVRTSESDRKVVAYLVNVYPAPSHTFIRAEIAALEAAGWRVHRFSHRACADTLVDSADVSELMSTRVLAGTPPHEIVRAVIGCLIKNPVAFFATVCLSLRMASDRSYIKHLAYFVFACILSRRLWNLRCGHVHAHFGTNPATVACLTSRLASITYSVTFHGEYEFAASGLSQKVDHSKFIVTVTKSGLRLLRERYPKLAQKIMLVRCGLDEHWLHTRRVPPTSRPFFVCIARLHEHKNPLLLVEAAQMLNVQGVSFHLAVIGDGPLRGEMERRIAHLNLQGSVSLLGWLGRTEIQEQLRSARAVVLSSETEGLPMAIMEAFALERCVIATDVGGIAELVEPKSTGWLVARGDGQQLADAIKECICMPTEELEKMGVEARRRIESFQVRTSADQIINALSRR